MYIHVNVPIFVPGITGRNMYCRSGTATNTVLNNNMYVYMYVCMYVCMYVFQYLRSSVKAPCEYPSCATKSLKKREFNGCMLGMKSDK